MNLGKSLHQLNRKDTRLLPKFSLVAKICLALFISLSFIRAVSPVLHRVFAQQMPANYNMVQEEQKAMQEGANANSWVANSMNSTLVKSAILLSGPIPDSCFSTTNGTCYAPGSGQTIGGALGSTTGIIASLFTPPASGIEYVAQIKDSFLGKPAYAQGAGFTGLQPLLPLWRGFRNIIYILSSFIFVIIGIMIMLRVKISPQAVVTLQNAAPQLITTLILVTFSYAIAGLLIDFMNFIQAIAISILFSATGTNLTASLFTPTPTQQGLDQIRNLLGGNNVATYNFSSLAQYSGMWQTFTLITRLVPMTTITVTTFVLGGIISGLVTMNPVTGVLIGSALSVIVLLVVLIMVFITLIKFIFGAAKAYITVLFKIIISPLEIGMGAFPGSKIGFSSWITDLIANLSVFPIALLYLIFLNLIIDKLRGSTGLWSPPLIGVIGSASATFLPAIIGIAGLSIFSKLPDMIPQFIYNLKPSPWSQGISNNAKPENLPVFGGLYKNTKAAYDKKQGENMLADVNTFANRRVLGQPGQPENQPLQRGAAGARAGARANAGANPQTQVNTPPDLQ